MNDSADLPLGNQAVLDLVSRQAGLTFPASRHHDARRAIERGMSRAGLKDVAQFRELLQSENPAFDDLVAELTIGETYFLREPGQFDFVRQTVLPDLLLSKEPQRPIRVWSAGCATGEEAYSLAMVLAEAGLASRTHILATDISRAALAKAAAGIYRDWSLRGAAVATARRWLRRQGDTYVLPESLREHVVFAYLNLALDVYPSLANGTWGMDLIFCRNVLIYFDPETVNRVARRLFDSLAPGGWLVTASSDPPLGGLAPLEVVTTDQGLFYRRPSETDQRTEVLNRWMPRVEDRLANVAEVPIAVDGQSPSGDLQEAELKPPLAAATGDALDAANERPEPAETIRENPVLESHLQEIHTLANVNPAAAQQRCKEILERNPLWAELHYLNAVLLEGLDRSGESAAAARRAIYLDRSLAVAHFTLGVALQRQSDWDGARKAYRNALQLCLAQPADEVLRLAEGETAGRLAEAATAHLAILDAGNPGRRGGW